MINHTTNTDYDTTLSSIIPVKGNLLSVKGIQVESFGIRLYFQPFTKPVNIMFLENYEQKDLILSTSLIYHIPKNKNDVFLKTCENKVNVYQDIIQGKGSAKNEEDLIHLIPSLNENFAKIIEVFD